MLSVFIAVALIDRKGRKWLLYVSSFGMIIASVLFSVAVHEAHQHKTWAYLSVGFMVLYVIAFEIGLGPIPWLIVSEITPTKERGTVMSVASFVNWSANLVIAQFAPKVVDLAQFYPFAVVCAVAIPFTAFLVPETKGKTEQHVQQELGSRRYV